MMTLTTYTQLYIKPSQDSTGKQYSTVHNIPYCEPCTFSFSEILLNQLSTFILREKKEEKNQLNDRSFFDRFLLHF